jgi:hypothetical protein
MNFMQKALAYLNKPVGEVMDDLVGAAKSVTAAAAITIGSAVATLVPDQALAAVPASVSTTFTEMGDDFTTIFGLAFGPLVIIVGSMLAWRYVRKLGNKL